jgi:hypothetical protein
MRVTSNEGDFFGTRFSETAKPRDLSLWGDDLPNGFGLLLRAARAALGSVTASWPVTDQLQAGEIPRVLRRRRINRYCE